MMGKISHLKERIGVVFLLLRTPCKGCNMKREEYISDETVVKRANAAVRIELEKNKALDIPIVVYDRETQIIYQEGSDGTRTEVGRRMRKERYSERVAEKA